MNWFPKTKLYPPLPREDLIPREQLLHTLHDALLAHPLTLLSAPAGYGKTTLLAALPHTFPHLNLAWLALDGEDNDPVRFLTGLLAALGQLDPACGVTAQMLLGSLANPDVETPRIIGALINDVLETWSDPFVLILDDLHLITEPAVFAALDYLLERLPPQMHLAVGTRQAPPLALARLWARGQVIELDPVDLRFTLDETTLFLNEKLHLGLSPDDLAALQERTEGWPVGLRLLASSLERIADPADRAAFVAYLLHTDRRVFDFLADEVLNRQSETVRAFLLETSTLAELTAPLCNAVTGRVDAEIILEDLERRSLFLVALDLARTTFRYHALFAEFLRRQLAREMPARVLDLHRRAAEAQGNSAQAVGHYLAAEMWEQAAEVIMQLNKQMYHQGLLDTLVGWIDALPPKVREAHPDLLWHLGTCALLKGEAKVAQSLLGQALRDCEASGGDDMEQGDILTPMATSAFMEGDLERASALVHQALACLVEPRNLVQLLMIRAWLGFFRGDWKRAEADFATALAATEESDEPLVWLMLALYIGVQLAFLPGGLERIERFCRQAPAYVEAPISPLQLVIEEKMAFVHLWRGRLSEAVQSSERALAIKEQLGGFPFLGLDAVAYGAITYAARGETAAADCALDLLFDQIMQTVMFGRTGVRYLYTLGQTCWLQGRLEETRQAYARLCKAESAAVLAPVLALMTRALLEMTEQRYPQAESSLRQAISLGREIRFPVVSQNARLLLAHLYVEMGHTQDALAELAPILALCQREGTPGLILEQGAAIVPVLQLAVERGVHREFAAHLLDLLGVVGDLRPVIVPETGETLTPREVEVLRLVAAGASNPAIAEQLFITVRTVKSHVSNILRKLDVSSRLHAATRARELRII